MDHVYRTGCHVTFRIHSTFAIAKFDTLFSLLCTLGVTRPFSARWPGYEATQDTRVLTLDCVVCKQSVLPQAKEDLQHNSDSEYIL